jgi:hypothetical protein
MEQPKPIVVRVALDPTVHRLLRQLAAKGGTTHSVVIANLVRERAIAEGVTPDMLAGFGVWITQRDDV